ncbi:MAG: hypothetical protein AAGC92_16005 [Pseudomonadota bacterium]
MHANWSLNLAASLLVLGFGAASAPAQMVDEYVPTDGLEEFALCRAAVFYHLDSNARGDSAIPVFVARTLERQILFVMQESLNSRPPVSLEEGSVSLKFSESFFIGFSAVLRNERARMLDVRQRDEILVGCVPFIWALVEGQVNNLIAWRTQSVNAPARPPPAQEFERVDRVMEEMMR